MDWIGLTRDRDKWRAVVNTVMKLWIPLSIGTSSSGVLEQCEEKKLTVHV
jgi:hypothetical protein